MTLSIAHTFTSAQAQSVNPNLVSKNEWNSAHTITMATGAFLGRGSASAGTAEELVPNSTDFSFSAGAVAIGSGIIRVVDSDAAGTNVNTAQPLFPTTGSFTAEASTDYTFDAFFHITRAAGTTSHTTGVLFGGTATFSSIRYYASCANPTGNVLATPQVIVGDVATLVTLTAANTSATENLIIHLVGNMRTSGAGTIIPQFQYSAAPGGAPTVKANSFFRLRKVGTNAITAGGSWA